jgi:hypothetical protein
MGRDFGSGVEVVFSWPAVSGMCVSALVCDGQGISTITGSGLVVSLEPYGKIESLKRTSLDFSTVRFSRSHRR